MKFAGFKLLDVNSSVSLFVIFIDTLFIARWSGEDIKINQIS